MPLAFRVEHVHVLLQAAMIDQRDPARWGIWIAGTAPTLAEQEAASAGLIMLTSASASRHLCITASGLYALAGLHPAARQAQAA